MVMQKHTVIKLDIRVFHKDILITFKFDLLITICMYQFPQNIRKQILR